MAESVSTPAQEPVSPPAQNTYADAISGVQPPELPTPGPYKPFLSGEQKFILGFVILSGVVWYYKRKDLF